MQLAGKGRGDGFEFLTLKTFNPLELGFVVGSSPITGLARENSLWF